ncbi:pantetheine-phosphate adenylyltransferase [Paramaledivibacter caminithermalis]|jgi:pantetheine-phosphate adenylyltransferase|uniref:Phosphopantetheine adenylyltransferase n=1 Tax=Paramaledivibacter caminithermalis (strain DSM 15212 / CIP 107654 / DViRD3) TaxID=1121301 RepID=A0A1M6NIF2_PARC5|nr:pantetheine-phosphate adenylyltransferase [Paramaledivibacter caminithermalis]SHJ95467.1 Phosphopantetheine adenylyltransferase [Paramaledivibacter caminithermalis DSM 15212]
MKNAVYPGSFDPITNGHLDVIKRSAKIFDKVIVAVLNNPNKNPMFSLEERVELIKYATADVENVEIHCFSGLLVDYVKEKKIDVIIKGLRAVSDFEYEFQMALMNKKLDEDVETLFMTTSSKYSYLSSSIVKEVFKFGGCIKGLVPEIVIEKMRSKL